jgi:hypothetical protein
MEADDLIQELQTEYLEDTPDRVKNAVSGYSNLVQMSFVDTYFPLEIFLLNLFRMPMTKEQVRFDSKYAR